MTARQRDPQTGRFRVVKRGGQFPCCKHCGGHELYPLIPGGSHRYPCPNCHDDRPATQKPDVCHPEWLFFHPLHGDEWNHAHARIGEAANEALIEDHRDFDMAYHHAGLEVPVREPAVVYVHGRDGFVLELGGERSEHAASAWQIETATELHPSGPLPAVTGPMPSWADDDAELDEKIKAIFGEARFRAIRDDTAWSGMRFPAEDVPGPVEDPPTPGPGTPGEAGQ